MVEQATESGSVDPGAGEIAARALEFSTLTAEDVMIHRRYVVGFPEHAGVDEIRKVILEIGHRRVPVYRGSLDQIVGYVSWRDVTERVWNGQPIALAELVRPCHFVPETKQAIDLLKEMQAHGVQLAIAVDEHGGTAGIVTLEDLLEELVGDIFSEHDKRPGEIVRRDADGSFVAPGDAPIRDVSRATELELPGEDEATTIAGLCVLLNEGRIPRAGERFDAGAGAEIEVLDASVRRVRSVRLRPKLAAPRDA
jgi:putative hemolysin